MYVCVVRSTCTSILQNKYKYVPWSGYRDLMQQLQYPAASDIFLAALYYASAQPQNCSKVIVEFIPLVSMISCAILSETMLDTFNFCKTKARLF